MIKKIIFHLFLSSVLTSQMAVAGPAIPLRNFAESDLWGDIPARCPELVTRLVAEIAQRDRMFSDQAEGVTG